MALPEDETNSGHGAPRPAPEGKEDGGSPAISLFLCLWFTLVAVAFWGPYVHLDGFAPVGLALYGVAVLIIVAVASLRFLRRREEAKRHVD